MDADGACTSNAGRAMLTIEVEDYAAAKRILDELPNTMQKRMLLVALRASAKPMLQSARSKVPVRTGKLKKQLRTVRYKDRNASKSEVAIAVKPVFERTKKKGVVNEYYGKFIHEGTADPRTSKKGKLLVFDDAQGKRSSSATSGASGRHLIWSRLIRKTPNARRRSSATSWLRQSRSS